ncbi:NAD(P)H-dependent oxidoreductase [Candidatus Methylospira mobilis]|uniref:FMN-dependent NADH-azoreductase n=1 Tax=Candidatus Methylospira mobilis TaxID=1808979 RepID=UPI0028E9714A|nr:NAD(P)H-dependent oxidoreductase [Candidatus Methylospira mobilis]WNV05163.1 NAD(P)H-dependent oxidoreductase [Candidatus Methylospira mobilis]
MTNLLQINSSIFSSGGHSSLLANEFVDKWRTRNPNAQVTVRDLANDPLPHLDAARVSAYFTPSGARTPEQQVYVDESDALITELKEADVIVIGLPMYNFGIPSTLKAYFDRIARAGETFRYTENGPEGLLEGKEVYIFAARGGKYAGTSLDTETAYMRDFLGFIGITAVEFIYAEGLNMGDAAKDLAVAEAQKRLAELVV